ncbi:hypothetical protein BFJ63_vAg15489 [Fusarium oxysporum f. sp. narcissi]|uniref:Transcription factor domain-containing protein n=1 Tax=Fusarium oxysporum f. sp. narcissi TaxID=451672 RepID=A0A4Q2V940_FUSOX|nr:hypothetical protein BFJ63_vAg15489 [Fusarium oxysporum f. sp. narcissi]
MAAMAIFGVTYVSLPIEVVLVTEAARIAAPLQMTRSGADDISPDFQRTFWVIYSLESEFCFNTGRASGLPFSIHNYFALEETGFSLACSDTSPFPEAESGFVFADFMAESFPETEQGNNGR